MSKKAVEHHFQRSLGCSKFTQDSVADVQDQTSTVFRMLKATKYIFLNSGEDIWSADAVTDE